MNEFAPIAIKAAHQAGKLLLNYALKLPSLTIREKIPGELVSEADKEAELLIISIISEQFPDHSILAEESGETTGNDYKWIIDPLDGTTNFLHGVPQWSVSIALQYKNEMIVGVVYDPNLEETFIAMKGEGTTLNGKKVYVSDRDGLQSALIGTGTPYRDQRFLDSYLNVMRKVITSGTAGVRRPGSAALDFAWLACGRYDGFWEYGLAPWDIAAGALMVQESGGIITDLSGTDKHLESGNVVAGNPHVHHQLQSLIQEFLNLELPC